MRRLTRGAAVVWGLAVVVCGLVCGLAFPSARAYACGGLFCNRPPPNPFDPLPVAQTGENVVFAVDPDPVTGSSRVAVHIQVMYTGPADKFSWVVPVDAVPQLGTGTDRLFSALGSQTRPSFLANTVVDGQCIVQPGAGGAFGSSQDAGFATGTGTGGAAGSGGPTVTVAFQGAVGPYDAAVIQSSDAAALESWLTDNGYFVGPDAAMIIEQYVREGKYFVALKLLNGKDVRSIRPIVLTFNGTEPCVPLRLTAIAALPDMQVTVWVLGPSRAVPKRFFELKLDELRIDWPSGGSNYAAVLGDAANEAGGNAFVTEYAGTSSIAARALWAEGLFNTNGLRAAQTPPVYVQALIGLGLANDPQVLPLLAQYIPMPDAVKAMGTTDAQFYSNISFYYTQFAFPPFDLATLTDQIVATVIEPRHQAQLMIDAHPYLTRMNTFISPIEMDRDPLFTFNPDLPDVSPTHRAVMRTVCGNSQYLQCNAPVRLELPDGRMAWIRAGSKAATCQYLPYDYSLQELPAAEIVWERAESGEGARRVDNQAAILTALDAHNARYPTESGVSPTPKMGAGGAGGAPGAIDPGLIGGRGGGGCGCALGGGTFGPVAGMIALAIVLSRRRRRS